MEDFVVVEESWLTKAKEYGTQRDALNGGNDTPAYAHDGPLPYSSLTASRLAVVGEVAAHLYFQVDPEATTFVVERTAADYEALRANADLTVNGRKIEVRNATNPHRPIPVKEKDRDADAIVVQVFVEMEATGTGKKPTGKVYFLGWRAGSDYRPNHSKNGTDYRHYKKSMTDLKAVLDNVA